MKLAVAIANIALGLIYTCYGLMTIADLKRGWSTMGFSHFGMAWIAMAFTCGPHHLQHGLHSVTSSDAGGPLDLAAVLIGAPAGVTWFLLRLEALGDGQGDRAIRGTPAWVRAIPYISVGYVIAALIAAITVVHRSGSFTPRMTPNVLLLLVYSLIGYYLLRTQLGNRDVVGGWSLSGLALTLVFPTCGLMHATFALYAASSRYTVDPYGLAIDWLAVPAAVYFVWVTRALGRGALTDWNEGATGVLPELVGT
jgi:hypothetical protein